MINWDKGKAVEFLLESLGKWAHWECSSLLICVVLTSSLIHIVCEMVQS